MDKSVFLNFLILSFTEHPPQFHSRVTQDFFLQFGIRTTKIADFCSILNVCEAAINLLFAYNTFLYWFPLYSLMPISRPLENRLFPAVAGGLHMRLALGAGWPSSTILAKVVVQGQNLLQARVQGLFLEQPLVALVAEVFDERVSFILTDLVDVVESDKLAVPGLGKSYFAAPSAIVLVPVFEQVVLSVLVPADGAVLHPMGESLLAQVAAIILTRNACHFVLVATVESRICDWPLAEGTGYWSTHLLYLG